VTCSSAYRYPTEESKSIVYNVVKTDTGWRIEANLPKRVPPTDRMKVLTWLDSYASQVRTRHPQWNTRFRATDQTYLVDIHQLDSPADVAKATQALEGEMWQQLTLDYVR
jgi:hypothetical protein